MINTNRLRPLWLLLSILVGLAIAWIGLAPPAPVPASAPPTAFSTGRALADIEVLAARPHPTGSPENRRIRDWLVGRMTSLGLSPSVQRTTGLNASDDWISAGLVENIVGVLPGKDRKAPAVMLMAHYDTVPGSPGAGDDSTGVAAILETVRAIKARGVPARDIIVLITDSEETGLLGANAFFAEHPMAGRVGVIINLEARGGGGRANMFETSRENGELIALYKTTARRPISSALSVFLYEQMPNGTDFTIPKDKGIAGLNFAFIGRQFDYHSATATVANLDKGSVQSIGEQALEAAAVLAYAPALPGKAPSAVYSQTFGDHILAYPPAWGWIAVALVGALLLIAGWRARRAGLALGWLDGLKGAGSGVLILLAAALALHLARKATGVGFGFFEQRPLLAQWALWEACMVLLGLAMLIGVAWLAARGRARLWTALGLLALGGACSLFGGFDPVGLGLGVGSAVLAALVLGRPGQTEGTWAGLLLLGFLISGLAQLLRPEVAFLFSWPLVVAGVAAAATGFRSTGLMALAPALAGAVVVGWLGPYLHLTAQGLDLPVILCLFALIAAFALWPLASGHDSRLSAAPALLALAAGLVLFGLVRHTDPWSERYPQASSLMHVTDSVSGKAWLATPALTDWSRKALTAGGGELVEASLPPWASDPVPVTATAPVAAPAAALESRVEPDGRVVVTLTPPPGARLMRMEIESRHSLDDARLQDRPVKLQPAGKATTISWTGDGAPLVLSFMPKASATPAGARGGTAQVRFFTVTESWPRAAPPPPPRPGDVMPWGLSDSTIVTGRAGVGW